MSRHNYTKEQKQFIKDNYKGITSRKLAELFNKKFNTNLTMSQMSNFKRHRGWLTGRKHITYKRLFTKTQEEFIKVHYKGISSQELADVFNTHFKSAYTDEQMRAYKSREGLSSGYCAQFKPGHEPANKGKTWDEYMSKEGQISSSKTLFKKGDEPPNKKPLGSERVTVDGYIQIKIKEPDVWVTKHRYLFEKEYGSVPKTHRLIFLDGNKQNLDLNNIKMIPNNIAGVMAKQRYFSDDPKLTEAGTLLSEIQVKTTNLKSEKS